MADEESTGRELRRAPKGFNDFEGQRQKKLIASAIFGRPAQPTMLDRYTVIRELGTGGMGKVYLAYDDQLDRRVAIKLLHGGGSSSVAQIRLQREAQAMAKLSHPNVVAVYEVGRFEGQLFVAMEYVKGQDLRSWLAAAPRGIEDIRAVFLAAGAGLAAAHGAGLVHRDFKPDNVLVGEDGRIRVADFGLAFGLHAEDTEPELSSSNKLSAQLTRTGALVGTPAYMSPEQYLSRPTDARSDQFSFCVALWEAVHGRRPFLGQSMVELSEQVVFGLVHSPPEDALTGARGWIHSVALRGLAKNPDERWPDMDALLAALADDPAARRRRRRRALALVLVTVSLLSGLSWITARELRENAQARYWNSLTAELLAIERERGLRQLRDDAQRARDAARMSVYRSYRSKDGIGDHEDPTVAAELLREVGEEARSGEAWISAANLSLGRPLSHAVLGDHRDTIFALRFVGEDTLVSGAADGEVRLWRVGDGGGRLLYRHQGVVNELAAAADGQTLASVADDGALRLWSPTKGVQLLHEGKAELTSVGFAPSGEWLVVTSRDGSSRSIGLDGEQRLLDRGTKAIRGADFDAAGQRVVTCGDDGIARLWQVDGELLAELVGHRTRVDHCRFAAADQVITGSDDGTIRAWTIDGAGRLVDARILANHGRAAVTAIAVHEGRVASAAVDGSVLIAALAQPDERSVLRLFDEEPETGAGIGVWDLRFRPDGSQLVVAGFDGVARIVPTDGHGPNRELIGHREPLLRLALSPSGRWLATGSWDTDIRVWDLDRPMLELPLLGHRDRLQSVRVANDGRRVLTAGSDGSVRVWDAHDGAPLTRIDNSRPANVAIFSPDGALVAAGHNDGDVVLWDPQTDEHRLLLGHELGVHDLAFSPSSALLASASSDGSVRIWPVAGGDPLVLRGHEGVVLRVLFGVDGERLISAGADGKLMLWSSRSGERLGTLDGHGGPVRDLALSPDGRVLASASDDGTAQLWPALGAQAVVVLRGHDKRVQSVAFDRRGARVITASADGSARVWATTDGTLQATLLGHTGSLWAADFVDDDRVVTTGDDDTLRLWSLVGAEPIVLTGHDAAIIDLAVEPDARWLVTASVDGSARIWRIDQLSDDPRVLAARLATATVACLDPEQRIRDLGEAASEASAAHASCARAHGREPSAQRP